MLELYISKKIIKKDTNNEVTSEKLFKPRRCKDRDGNWRFHSEGIFSREIFGNIGICSCGANETENTWCKMCGGRVISRENMPDFYIPLDIVVPMINANYSVFGNKAEDVKSIMNYKSFIYNGEIVPYDLEKLDLSLYNPEDVLIGTDALKSMGILSEAEVEKWVNDYTITDIPIPHPVFRPLISANNGTYVLGPINTMLVEILTNRKKLLSYRSLKNLSAFHEMTIRSSICEKYNELVEAIFKIITDGKKSVIKQEIISQSITGAIRAVITNDHSLSEDYISIGYELVETLWPNMYKECEGDIAKMNAELISGDYHVIVNRPPTIGQKSIICMKPIISEDPAKRFVIGTNSIVFDGLAGDTDGDVLLVIALYSREATEEAKSLMPSVNYIGANDGKIRNKIPEDFMYTMQRIYQKGLPEKAKIQKAIYGKSFKSLDSTDPMEEYKKDVAALESVPRSRYIKIYEGIGHLMWEHCNTPTVEDIANFIEGESSEEFEAITGFLGNADKLRKLVLKDNAAYSQEESSKHIKDVMASNSTDIRDSGWFYKKLISSADDMTIFGDDCGSEGVKIDVSSIDEDRYNYEIKFAFVDELDCHVELEYSEFMKKIKSFSEITIHTPATCKHAKDRGFCRKCVGPIRLNHNKSFIPPNIGIFTTLMVTEHATQASLDSMNKGSAQNLNTILERSFEKKRMSWEEVIEEVDKACEEIGWIGVQKRFYEISLLSRFYKKGNYYVGSSMQYSFKNHADPLGNFIYSSSMKNLINFINHPKVELTSMKSKIMFDVYD